MAENNITITNTQPLQYTTDFTFYSDYFVLGGGITTVVVWPQVQSPVGEPLIIQVMLIDASIGTGTDDKPSEPGDIKLYPNPAYDKLIVGANGLKSALERVRIYNLAGQVVMEVTNPSDTQQHLTIDLNSVSNGVYILEAVTPKGSIRKKFVKL
ncbi:MAG: T9SS type A sorting domain-containing protein [Sphingobacteriales bacterium JAD_PAG50586_3]|nr:MAG: T9SS type A sorting domain-containing protein [Sphingobacteriales bacterium JAD_PAG50586_3]